MNKILIFIAIMILTALVGCKTTQQAAPAPQQPPSPPSTSASTPSPASQSPTTQSSSQQRKQTKASTKSQQQSNQSTSQQQQTRAQAAENNSQSGAMDRGDPDSSDDQQQGESTMAQDASDEVSGDSSQNPSEDIDFSEQENSSSRSKEATEQQSSSSQAASSANENSSSSSTNSGASSQPSPSAPAGNDAAMTGTEQTAVLDGKLEQSMSDYDAMILSEREYIQNRGNEKGSEDQVAAAAAAADAGPLYDDVLNGQPESGAAGSPNSGGGTMPNLPSSNTEGAITHNQKVYAPPADIPTGNDDDVVARQIREAALKEQDPKLREKLWQEYRKYKGNDK